MKITIHDRDSFVANALGGLLVLTFLAVIGLSGWYGWEVINADILPAFRYSRYYQMINFFLMICSLSFMAKHHRSALLRSVPSHGSHTTDIVYVFLLGGSSFVGYLQLFATYIAFLENNEALTYSGEDELVFDFLFISVVIIFIPTVAYYVLFFVPYYSKAGKTAWFIILTLFSGVLQKFGFEFVEYKKHYCHRVNHDESSFYCPNWNDSGVYNHTIDEMTKRAQFLHDLSGFYGAATYTATLDFLLSCGVVLYCHQSTAPKILALPPLPPIAAPIRNPVYDPADGEDVHPNNVSINRIPFHPNPLDSNPFGEHKPCCLITFCSWLTVYVALFLKMLAFVWQPSLLSFKEKNWVEAFLNFNILELVIHLVCLTAFSLVFWGRARSCGSAWDEICHWKTIRHLKSTLRCYSQVPDLFILIFALVLAILFIGAKIGCHMYAIWNFEIQANEEAAVIVNSVGEFFLLLAFYAQFLVIKRFLLCDATYYTSLRQIKFLRHLAPVAALMNIWRFLTIFANKQAFLPFMFTSQPLLDNFLLGLESFYPVSNIFSLTAAICWCHVIERMIKTDDHSDRVRPQIRLPSNANDIIAHVDDNAAGTSAVRFQRHPIKEQRVREIRQKQRKTSGSEVRLLDEDSKHYGTPT